MTYITYKSIQNKMPVTTRSQSQILLNSVSENMNYGINYPKKEEYTNKIFNINEPINTKAISYSFQCSNIQRFRLYF